MKHDCVFGDDLDVDEISTVSEVNCFSDPGAQLCLGVQITRTLEIYSPF